MLPADCLLKTSADGSETFMIVQTRSGHKYRVIEPINEGGVGRIYLCVGQDASGALRRYALKEYPVPEDDDMRRQQRDIRANLEALIHDPVLNEHGRPLETMVAPIEIIDFPNTGSFGYVMDYVDLDDYFSISQLLSAYPEADVLCRIGKNFSHFFVCLAGGSGKSYKDINEGNVYIDPITGEIRIIDNDNVGTADSRTISGTLFYMAPEVQSGLAQPDRVTDRFSMAAFLLRLFTGAYPYEGRSALQYTQEHEMNVFDAAPVIFGTQAKFIFDPDDDENSIRGYDPGADATEDALRRSRAWQIQCNLWDALPEALRGAFIRALANNPDHDRAARPTALQWYELFLQLEKTIVSCPDCGRRIFGDSEHCPGCGAAVTKTICRHCGQKTPEGCETCVHCGEDPRSTPEKTALCPHCESENPKSARVCKHCGRYIRVTCAKCGASHSGDAERCGACGTILYRICPECGRPVPLSDAACPHCGCRETPRRRRCTTCGRMAMPGQTFCICCGQRLTAGEPGPARSLVLELAVRIGCEVHMCSLNHRFPARPGAHYCGDQLHPSLPHKPLFTLLYYPQRDAFALQNLSGKDIRCLSQYGGERAFALANDKFTVISPGDVFKFSDSLQIRIESLR